MTEGIENPQDEILNPDENIDDPESEPKTKTEEEGDDYDPFISLPEADTATEDEDEIDPDDAKKINKLMSPVQKELDELKAINTVRDYLDSEDGQHLKPYKEQIIKVAKDPRTKGMRIQSIIAAALGADKLLKIGAQIAANVNNNANMDMIPSSGRRTSTPSTSLPDPRNMTSEQFQAQVRKMMRTP